MINNTIPCVYRIWNEKTNYFYIGSAINYKQRWRNHRNSLITGTHGNKHLQNAWNKYGENSFVFEVIEFFFNKEIILEREQHYINIALMINKNNIYNVNLTTKVGGFHGRKHTNETKLKMSKKRIGVSLTKGDKNPNAKLSLEKVNEIRNLFKSNQYSFAELGRIYSVSYQTISEIIKNKFWRV